MAPSNQKKVLQSTLSKFFHVVKDGRVEKSRTLAKPKSPISAATTPRNDELTPGLDRVLEPEVDKRSQDIRESNKALSKSKGVRKGRGKNNKALVSKPVVLDGDEELVGFGAYQVICAVKILQQHSSAFFEGPISQVDKSKEATVECYRQAANWPLVEKSTVVKTLDGTPLIYFIKGGMLAGLSAEDQENLPQQSMNAIEALIAAYKPPLNQKGDSRVSQMEQMERFEEKGLPWGRYYLSYRFVTGYNWQPARLHEQCFPRRQEAKDKLAEYVAATTWEHEQIAKWIQMIDPEMHAKLHDRYQELGPAELKHMYQGPNACHSGTALLINEAVNPHKDQNDAIDSWTPTNCWGKFKGGYVGLKELGIKIAHEEGDIVLMHAAVLTHFVEEVEEGERYCHVRFTKESILRPVTPKPALDIPCPFEGCGVVKRSEGALKDHLRGPTKPALRRIAEARGCYHMLSAKDALRFTKQAVAAHRKRLQDFP